MNSVKLKYCPMVPEEPQPESRLTQWSLGIAMFAAFVIPFILLLTSARYRVFVAQAKHTLESVSPTNVKFKREMLPFEEPTNVQKENHSSQPAFLARDRGGCDLGRALHPVCVSAHAAEDHCAEVKEIRIDAVRCQSDEDARKDCASSRTANPSRTSEPRLATARAR